MVLEAGKAGQDEVLRLRHDRLAVKEHVATAEGFRRLLQAANEELVLSALRAQELAEQAQQAESVLEGLSEIVSRFDARLRLLYVNPAVEALTGRPRADFVGKSNEDIGVPCALAEQWNALVRRAFATASSTHTVLTWDAPQGPRVLHVGTVVERRTDGAIASVVTVARDVTDSEMYRRARQDADRLRRLQDVTAAFSAASTPHDIADILLDHCKAALNADAGAVLLADGAARLVVTATRGLPGRVAKRAWSLPMDARSPIANAARSREPVVLESREAVLERYPGAEAIAPRSFCALAAVPLTWGERVFGVLALHFRQAHELTATDREFVCTLARYSAQAIDRAHLLDAERAARRESEAASRLKDEFLATLSHELRTPLNAVLGWSSVLRTKELDPHVRRAVDAIERNARAQTKLVEDLLDVSRIVNGKLRLELEDVDVGSVLRAAVDIVRPAANAKQIKLRVRLKDVCVVAADAARLQQVVWNVVGNAVKFTPEGGRVDVTLAKIGSHAVIRVQDTGVGIAREFLPHVFERFRQEDPSPTRAHGGLGLGLAIAHHLVELHGGTVRAESDGIGKGACFTVELPSSAR